jgi:O-antigen/teichoic acid export membrane protein
MKSAEGIVSLIKGIVSFIKATFVDALGLVRSPGQGLRSLYGVSLYRNAVYLVVNAAVLAVAGFFFWMVAARLYPTEAVGLSSAAISALGLLALLSTLGLEYGLIRFLPSSGQNAQALINSCFSIGALVSLALSLIFLAGLDIWSPALSPLRQSPVFFLAFVVFAVAGTLNIFVHQSFVAERRARFALARGLIFGIVRFIPLIALATFHAFGIFTSWGIALFVAAAAGIFLFLPRIRKGYRPFPTVRRGVVNEMVHFSVANYAVSIFWTMTGFILPLIVLNLLGAEQTAYFYIAWTIGNILLMVPAATSLSLFAEGSYNEERLAGDVRRSLKLILLILIVAIIIIFALGDRILLLFGAAYSESATKLLWLLALSALPASINYVYFSMKRVEMRMRSVVALTAFTAAATMGLSYVLFPRVGIAGAGIAWLASQIVVALVAGRELWKRTSGVH